MKRCSTCGETRDVAEFHRNARNRDGRDGRCRDCVRTANRIKNERYRRSHGESVRARKQAWTAVNAERVRVANREAQRRSRRERRITGTLESDSPRHRAKRYGVQYERFGRRFIFERDNWTCQICGERVDPTQRAPHPLTPTLDHIVPMSLGGAHVRTNVQCACWRCNIRKGNRIAATEGAHG